LQGQAFFLYDDNCFSSSPDFPVSEFGHPNNLLHIQALINSIRGSPHDDVHCDRPRATPFTGSNQTFNLAGSSANQGMSRYHLDGDQSSHGLVSKS
jgi:hypothetical protein